MKFIFEIYCPGEREAGLLPYRETVTVETEHHTPDAEEFSEHMKNALAEWYDTAGIECVQPPIE